MGERQNTRTLLLTSAGVLCAALAIAAQAQTVTSPFAKKKKKQAWETQTPAQTPPAETAPTVTGLRPTTAHSPASAPSTPLPPSAYSSSPYTSTSAPTSGTYVPQSHTAPSNNYGGAEASKPASVTLYGTGEGASSSSAPATYNPPTASAYNPPVTYAAPTNRASTQQSGTPYGGYQNAPQYAQEEPLPEVETLSGRPYYPGRSQRSQDTGQGHYAPNAGQIQGPQAPQGMYNPNARPAPPVPTTQKRKKGLQKRLGFGGLIATLSGYLRLGAAATERTDTVNNNDWSEDFIADGSVRGELSGVTGGGLEFGAGVELRGQYDKYRRGFGGLTGDCAPTLAGCPSVLVAGTPTSVRGHTSQFYSSGASDAKDGEYALEGAYLFLRTAYGDLTVGRDDGAAYLFSLGAPSLLAVGASNSPVDYTGLDSVKTVNDASGFSEKVTYVSPRLLGDTVGVGVQIGASYSLNAKACGVDYCVRADGKDGSGTVSPDLENLMEAGISLDRTFGNGLSVEATATYAVGSEKSGLPAFDDLRALGLGAELGYKAVTLGGSYLDSNNGLANGDYTAWDAGMTIQPNKFGFTVGYGEAKDKNINLKSKQAVIGMSYDWNDYFRLGTGVQHVNRTTTYTPGGILTPTKEKATSVFVEGRVTF